MVGPLSKRGTEWGHICLCDCGNEKWVSNSNVGRHTFSCGCRLKEAHTVHGLAKHPLYFVWVNMVKRCTDPNHKSHDTYAHVNVFPEWLNGPEKYIEYVDTVLGPKPGSGYSIDRIDNLGNYEPGNLRWATPLVQRHNQRNMRKYVWEGSLRTTEELANIAGISYGAMKQRLTINKWPIEKAMSVPLVPRNLRHLYGQDRIPNKEELPNPC